MNWDMIGHDWAVNLLKTHITKNNIKHAYLFTGPPSVGKRTLAIRFIQALTCSDPPQVGEYCGVCRSCQLILQNAYPDLHIITAEEDERSIKVDQIRALRRSLSLSPNEGSRRVTLLGGFHNATEQAANALLKTLEEPPPQVVIIITAVSKESLLPTIVSRCEVISLRPITTSDLARFLISQGETEEKAHLLAGVAYGRPGYALAVQNDPALLEHRARLLDEMGDLIGGDRFRRFSYIKDWNASLRKRFPNLEDRRQECLEVLELWLGYWRDVMLVGYGALSPKSNPDRKNEVALFSKGIPKDQIIKSIVAIQDTIKAIESNANLRLVLETLMLDLPRFDMEQVGRK